MENNGFSVSLSLDKSRSAEKMHILCSVFKKKSSICFEGKEVVEASQGNSIGNK